MLTFALASIGSFLAFEWPPLLRKIVFTLLLAFIVFRVVRAVAKWLFAFGGPGGASSQPTSLSKAMQLLISGFGGLALIAGFLLFGWAIVSLMPALGFSIEVTRLAAFLFGLGILATAIEVVWRRPGKPASLVAKSLLTLYLIVLWLAWVAGLLGLLWLGIFSLHPADDGARRRRRGTGLWPAGAIAPEPSA